MYIELSTAGIVGVVQRDDFCAENVIPWLNTARYREVRISTVGNHVIHAPFAICETVGEDLEPFQAGGAGCAGVVDFCSWETLALYGEKSS